MGAVAAPLAASTAPSLSCVAGGSPARLGGLIAAQLARLLPVYAPDPVTAEKLRRLLALLAAESLDRPAEPPFDGLSFINANGLPFQWAFSLGAHGSGFGFLCEIGRAGASPAERSEQSLDRIEAASRLVHDRVPDFLREAAGLMLPATDEPWPAHWRSAAWIGVAIRGRAVVLKPYFNLNRGTCRDRWLRAGWLLKALGRDRALGQLCALSSCCSADSWPVGLAFDVGCEAAIGRVKLYFRSSATNLDWLVRWHEAAGLSTAAPEVRRFLDLFGPANHRKLPNGAMVVSLEIHPDERLSLKTDLAVTKWTADDSPLLEAAAAYLAPLGTAAATLSASLSALGLQHGAGARSSVLRFVGLGLETDGSPHLNLYVEPPLTRSPPRTARSALERCHSPTAIARAVRKGVAALFEALDDNHWEDFALPVGSSDAWVTAYILAMLADLPGDFRAELRSRVSAPVAWLQGQRHRGGGWGYNGGVPPDADSTAWAIIALRACGALVPAGAVRFLAHCREGGQFRTYPAETSPARAWAAPAPDVGAVAARALGGPTLDPLPGQEELVPAYWWTSPVYTTAMRLDGGAGPVSVALRERLAAISPAGAFERALLLRALLRAGLPVPLLPADLVAGQGPRGLWPASARLRLADDKPEPPWRRIDSGTLYTDIRGLFTTATAVAALGLMLGARRGS